jgi:hypothetical protein
MLMPEYREKQSVDLNVNVDASGFKELLQQRIARLEESA